MEASEILDNVGTINQGYRPKHRSSTSDLVSVGWSQIDGNGLFYRSALSKNGFAIELTLCNSPHVTISRDYHIIENLDGASDGDLNHLKEKLEQLEIWQIM